jgi:hypothetical protein
MTVGRRAGRAARGQDRGIHQSIALAAYALSYKHQQLDFRALKS